jgi:serine/threonine-protein kinase
MAEIGPDTLIDGRYKVLSRLGTGGMADVFLAEDQQLGRKIALKLLHRRFAEDPGFVERFRREAQSAAGLAHPNIVSVYDRGEYDGTYYIAMEYLPGRSLKQLIREEAPLDPVRAIDIAIQILKAARFAHRRGVIHRDLKPHNVIVDDTGHAKVTDFGIARAGASDMTETGSIMGTAQYLSPEQAQGHAVNEASDLYSVGVVLYEMLTGRVPFDAEAAVTIALKHVSEAPPPPSRFNPAVPPELEQTVLWTLNKNPADRPVDGDQLIAVLEHCKTAIESGAAGHNTASMAAVAAAGAFTGATIAQPAGTLGAAGGSAPPLRLRPGANGAGERGGRDGAAAGPGEAPRRRRWVPLALVVLVALLVAGAATAAYYISRPKQYVVPNVTGTGQGYGVRLLRERHFQVSIFGQADASPAGTVIGETPAAGSKADKGSTIVLTVSRGLGKVAVPVVQGLNLSQARRELQESGLKVGPVRRIRSAQVKAGQAIGTDPAVAEPVTQGSTVTLVMSSGLPLKAVPAVQGYTRAAATEFLQGAGFKVRATTAVSTSAPAGTVSAQSPAAGIPLAEGQTVSITVAKAATAPATVPVPPVVGDPVTVALSDLRAAHFAVTVTTKTVKRRSRDGIVLSQRPRSGGQANKGANVTIVVGSYIPRPHTTSSTTTSTTSSTPSTTSTTSTTTSSTTSSTTTPASSTTTSLSPSTTAASSTTTTVG